MSSLVVEKQIAFYVAAPRRDFKGEAAAAGGMVFCYTACRMIRPLHLAALVGINAIFAGSYIAGKIGVGHFEPLFFSAARFVLVFAALLPFFRLRPVPPAHRRTFFGFCFGMGIGVYSTMYLALAAADGVSAVLIGTQFSVPMAALLGMWLRGDRISKTTWIGIVTAFAGVMIVGFDGVILGYGLAFMFVMLSAFFYAYANVLSQQLGGIVSVLNLNAWMALLSIAPMLALSFVFEGNQLPSLLAAQPADWAALLYSALAVSLLGHGGMFAMLRLYPVAQVMPFYVLVPIFGVVGGLVFFSETPTLKFYAGALVALLGVWIVNTLGARRARATG